jgi:N-dimethylarginine dimethylaminohydrolase
MCPPDFFGIEYEINPWMSLKNPADPKRAGKQWDRLFRLLTETLAIPVELVAPRSGLPDLVFTANAGLAAGNKIWISNFRHEERRGEQAVFIDWFVRHGYETVEMSPDISFEGEGDFLWMGEHLFGGYPFRTDLSAHVLLSGALKCDLISLELIHPKFYHLDTCFCPLDSRSALFVPDAFSPGSLKILSATVENLIPLNPAESALFAANAIVTESAVVFQAGAEEIRKKIEREGFDVYPVDLSEFIKAGGSAKCLVLWLE